MNTFLTPLSIRSTLFIVVASGLSIVASRAQIADYNADDQALGALTVFTDSTGNHNATGTGTVSNAGTVFNGHNYVVIGGGFLADNLYSGNVSRTVAAVYANPFGDNGGINPVAGEEGSQNYAQWFALEARTRYAAGDPYLVNAGPDLSSGGDPVANRLTFALGTYDSSSAVETLYWAYGGGAVQKTSVSVTLNTNADDFGIGTTTAETSEQNMDIGRVEVYNSSMTDAQAASLIETLQTDYGVPEPSTCAMMFCGIVLLGFGVRRKIA